MSIIAEFFSIIARQKSPGPLLREAQAEERSHPLLSLVSSHSTSGKSVQHPSGTLRSDPKLVKARAIHQITFEAFWERLESTWERAVASPHRSRCLIHTYGLGLGKSVQHPSGTLRSDPKLVKARAIHQITFEAFWERLESTWERAVAHSSSLPLQMRQQTRRLLDWAVSCMVSTGMHMWWLSRKSTSGGFTFQSWNFWLLVSAPSSSRPFCPQERRGSHMVLMPLPRSPRSPERPSQVKYSC